MPSGFLSGNTKKTSRSESTKLKFLSKKSIYSPPGMCFVSWVRLGTFISLVTLGRGKLKAAFCPSVSLGKLSSGQVVPASPRPTDSEPCGCPDSLPKRCLGNFLVRSGGFWVFHERCLGRTLSMALTFVTNQFVLLAISGNGVQRFSVRSFQHVLSGGAAQHATKRPAMVWRRILRSGTSLNTITPFQWYFLLNLLFQDVLDSFTWLIFFDLAVVLAWHLWMHPMWTGRLLQWVRYLYEATWKAAFFILIIDMSTCGTWYIMLPL